MRFGISTPVVIAFPGRFADWEATAGISEIAEIGAAADRLGYAHLTCSEHVAVPTEVARVRGGTYWDPLATLGFVAARTERIRLVTSVLVLGYHHPLAIAKRYGTLDAVSGGRLVLGFGVGTLKEEFELLGAQFEGRGARADDALRALRAAMSRREPSYDGPYYSFSGFEVVPHAVQERVPFWIGGQSRRSLQRAAELADGWVPMPLPRERIAELMAGVDLPDGFDVVLGTGPVDAVGDRAGTEKAVEAARAMGATIANITFRHSSLSEYLEQLEAFQQIAFPDGAPA